MDFKIDSECVVMINCFATQISFNLLIFENSQSSFYGMKENGFDLQFVFMVCVPFGEMSKFLGQM